MKKIYLVFWKEIDDIVRIFDSREKAIKYINEQAEKTAEIEYTDFMVEKAKYNILERMAK